MSSLVILVAAGFLLIARCQLRRQGVLYRELFGKNAPTLFAPWHRPSNRTLLFFEAVLLVTGFFMLARVHFGLLIVGYSLLTLVAPWLPPGFATDSVLSELIDGIDLRISSARDAMVRNSRLICNRLSAERRTNLHDQAVIETDEFFTDAAGAFSREDWITVTTAELGDAVLFSKVVAPLHPIVSTGSLLLTTLRSGSAGELLAKNRLAKKAA